jgi:hypothetical protein
VRSTNESAVWFLWSPKYILSHLMHHYTSDTNHVSYLTESRLRFNYKEQPVNAVYCEIYESHKYTRRAKLSVFHFREGGTNGNHYALKLE